MRSHPITRHITRDVSVEPAEELRHPDGRVRICRSCHQTLTTGNASPYWPTTAEEPGYRNECRACTVEAERRRRAARSGD